MKPIRDRPILTDIYESAKDFAPDNDSVYIFALSLEDRFDHVQQWSANATAISFVTVVEQTTSEFVYDRNSSRVKVPLRSERQLTQFWKSIGERRIYLDLTGFSHHVWAPLIRMAFIAGSALRVVYAEPRRYKFNIKPTEGEIFDLSEQIMGISPLPGFASLNHNSEEDVCFVPLLGFEGTRLAYLLEQVQPIGEKIYPVIGVPGFRIEYPFHAYQGNRLPLIDSQSWRRIRFATANDPFSLFYALEDIAVVFPRDHLKVATIGTKPHSLGAVLYALTRPDSVELIYDHPIRKAQRTEGTARILVYHISAFLGSKM